MLAFAEAMPSRLSASTEAITIFIVRSENVVGHAATY